MSGFEIGQTVQLNDGGRLGIVRYAGQPDFAPGEWIGVELEDGSGKNDGSVKGQRYFDCEMGRGMFLRPTAVRIIEQPPPKTKAPPAKRLSRPSSVAAPGAARRLSSVPDPAANKRMSINAASPSPVVRTRPSSLIGVCFPKNSKHMIPLMKACSRRQNRLQNNYLLRLRKHPLRGPALPPMLELLLCLWRNLNRVLVPTELRWAHQPHPLPEEVDSLLRGV
jgi:CAP-Gly domain